MACVLGTGDNGQARRLSGDGNGRYSLPEELKIPFIGILACLCL